MNNSYFKRFFRDKENKLWGIGNLVLDKMYVIGQLEPLKDESFGLTKEGLEIFMNTGNWKEER